MVRFQVPYIKVGYLGVLHKIRLEGDHQTLTFGFMQLVDNFSPQHLEKISGQISKKKLLPLQSPASDQSLGHKNSYTSVSVLEKRPLKDSKWSTSVGFFG